VSSLLSEDDKDNQVGKLSVTDNDSAVKSIGTNRMSSKDSISKEDRGDEAYEAKFSDIFELQQIFWVLAISCVVVYGCVLPFNNVESPILLERDFFMDPPSGCQLTNTSQCESDFNEPEGCPSSKWYQPPLPQYIEIDGDIYNPLQSSDIDCTDDLWSDGCTKEYCDRQTDATIKAGQVMSIPYIISATLSPFLGAFVDKFGLRAVMATLSPLLLVIVHGLLGYTDVNPIYPLVGQGLAYSGFAAVLWPSLPLVVPKRLTGMAYGVVTSVQNCGLASFPLIIAYIYSSHNDSYIPAVETFFVILGIVGVIVGLYINFYDYYYLNSKLNTGGDKDDGSNLFHEADIRTMSLERSSTDLNRLISNMDEDENSRGSAEIFATSGIH